MREIKFRVWDDGKMYHFGLFDLDNCYIIDDSHSVSNDAMRNVMQYTGLKDKNGIEIYEGDIMKHNSGYWFIKYENAAYHLYHAGIKDYYKNYLRWGLLNRLFDTDMEDIFITAEVIGNIHENPELLDQI